jgi:hypothetical protein
MEKLIYVGWRAGDAAPGAATRVLLDQVGPALLDLDVRGLRINVEEQMADYLQVGAAPDGGRLAAAVSVWLGSVDDRGAVEAALEPAGLQWHGWLVTESEARGYGTQRSWADGERSPGLSLVTVFDKKPDLDDVTFYAIWHGEHTPLSFEIHPFWLYVRNAVVRPLTAGAPPVRGIVYEAVRVPEDMTELGRFFGAPDDKDQMLANITRVDAHLKTFADTTTLQCTPMAEHILRTLST